MIAGVSLPLLEPGTVWLVGAGPGDVGLLTLHAVNALKQADVVVHDALIGKDILALVNASARLEFAGKRGGQPSAHQSDISERLIALARAGSRVVRLKGGDPFVFGRGGEEAMALTDAGIRYAVVPGITSGIAALSAAAIPTTMRDANSAVIFATGHPASVHVGMADWSRLVNAGEPLVLYMAMHNLAQTAERLVASGLSAGTPVAIVMNATTRKQQVLETTLAEAAEDARKAGLHAPAIVAIGSIVPMRAKLKNNFIQLIGTTGAGFAISSEEIRP